MSGRFVRQSQFRQLRDERASRADETYMIPRAATHTVEGTFIKVNTKYWACHATQDSIRVYKLSEFGTLSETDGIRVNHLSKPCLDFDFHPFRSNVVATAGAGGVAVTSFTESKEGNSMSALDVRGELASSLVQWNPAAGGILSTVTKSKKLHVFNVQEEKEYCAPMVLEGMASSMTWSPDGGLLYTTHKQSGSGQQALIWDPRDMNPVVKFKACDGIRSASGFWAPRLNSFGAAGYNARGKRCIRVWDVRKLSGAADHNDPWGECDAGDATGNIWAHYDDATGLLYLTGRGMSTLDYFEVTPNDKPGVFKLLNHFRDTTPHVGVCMAPKRMVDTRKAEVARLYRIQKNSVGRFVIQPVPMIAPRQGADVEFQEALYPDCLSGKPAMTASEWADDKKTVTWEQLPRVSMRDLFEGKAVGDDDEGPSDDPMSRPKSELAKENKELKARVAALEAELAALKA